MKIKSKRNMKEYTTFWNKFKASNAAKNKLKYDAINLEKA